MKNLGAVTDNKDVATKEYVDNHTGVTAIVTTGTKIATVNGVDLYAPGTSYEEELNSAGGLTVTITG